MREDEHGKVALDYPFISLLNPETESIDLDELGELNLHTQLNSPTTSIGDYIHVHWRGRNAVGVPVDFVTPFEVLEFDHQGRIVVEIPNRVLQDLAGGDVFYSFALDAGGVPAEESRRLAFRVHRPVPVGAQALGIAQVRQAHDLWIAYNDLNSAPATVVTPPFQAMAKDVELTLHWQGYFEDDDPNVPYEPSYRLTAADVGRSVVWSVPWAEVASLEGGFVELYYSIRYANGEVSESQVQRYDIADVMPPVSPLLPVPSIKGHSGGSLDPDRYPDGIEVMIPPDPDGKLHVGDQLILYIEGGEPVVYAARVDLTTVDSQYMALHDRQWVQDKDNFDKLFSLSYQYARRGMARHSQSLDLALRRPLHLPAPIVVGADPEEGDNQGVVYPGDIRSGFEVRIPDDAVIDGGAVCLIFQGHGAAVTFEPSVGDPRLFKVPVHVIPANLGKRVLLHYTVTPPGEWGYPSDTFDLRKADYAMGSFPLIQGAQVRNGQLSFSEVTDPKGSLFTVASWPFMAAGQFLYIEATYEGLVTPLPMRVAEVTVDEYHAGRVEGRLTWEFLKQMRDKKLKMFRVQPRVSFDGEHTTKNFRFVDIHLVD